MRLNGAVELSGGATGDPNRHSFLCSCNADFRQRTHHQSHDGEGPFTAGRVLTPVDCLSQKAKDDDDDEMMVMLVVMTLTEGALGREDDTETEVAKVTMVMVMDGDNGDGDDIDARTHARTHRHAHTHTLIFPPNEHDLVPLSIKARRTRHAPKPLRRPRSPRGSRQQRKSTGCIEGTGDGVNQARRKKPSNPRALTAIAQDQRLNYVV